MTNLRIVSGVVLLSAIQLHAQQPTLRELAAQTQGKTAVMKMGCGWPGAPFKLIASQTDLVIEGTVTSHRAYLTSDDRDIFTDYEFSLRQIISQRAVQSSNRPGLPAPFVFKTEGGTVVLDGFPITVDVDSNGRRVTLKDGDHVIIFGKHDPADGKWRFSAWDVFYTSGDTVKNDLPVLEGHDEGLTPIMAIGVFGDKVREMAAR